MRFPRYQFAACGFICLSLLAAIALTMVVISPAPAAAADPREPFRIDFNDGSLIKDFAWWDDDQLCLYAVNPNGAIVWLHNIGSGERRKLVTARDLARIFGADANWSELRLSLSPHRRYLSFYAPPAGPLAPALFKVLDLGKGRATPVSFTKLPPGFIPGVHAWDNTGKYVYVAAREYMSPESDISLGRLSLETGTFLGLTRKSDLDLIQSLNYDPAHNALIIVSRGYKGAYPRQEFLLSYSLTTNELAQLGGAYLFRGIQVTVGGEILAATLNPQKSEGEFFPGFLMVAPEMHPPQTPEEGKAERLISQIILIRQDSEGRGKKGEDSPEVLLTGQLRGFDFNPYLSPDGRFMAFLRLFYRLPYAVEVHPPPNEAFLFLQERDSAQEFMVMQGADRFQVSPGEHYLAARSSDGTHLELFELPR